MPWARNMPIQQKLMTVILITSGSVLLVVCCAYFAYEYITFRHTSLRQLSTLGQIVATNSTAALAFDSREEATEILSALRAEGAIVASALYDEEGRLFAQYPVDLPAETLPEKPDVDGYRFGGPHIIGYQPVIQGSKRLGTLYVQSDMRALYERLQLYAGIVLLVLAISLMLAYLLSKRLQRRISEPVLALAETARAVSDRHDYSVRAVKTSEDELGLLTDAFNHMLTQIEEQNLALNESSTRVRAIVNSALSAVIVIDSLGRITDWNPRAEIMFGWMREEVLGLELAELIIPPRHRHAHTRGLEHHMNTGEGPVLNQLIELSALRRNGTEFPVELSINAMKAAGKTAFCGFITDITERKLAEESLRENKERLENIVESMGDAYISLDHEWRYTFVNSKALTLMNKSAEELIGNVLWDVFPDARGTAFEKEYQNVMTKRVASAFEVFYDSYNMWLEVRAYPHEEGIAIFYTDITKYRKAEEEIRRFSQKLEQMVKERTIELEVVNKELESFSYSVSHDLRAPLRAIHGYMNIFSEDYASKLDSEALRIMGIIQNNAKKMGQLIDDLLTFSRLGRKELVKTNIHMRSTVSAIYEDLLRMENNNRDVNVTMHELPDIYADKSSISQVWVNLISNALKYTRNRSATRIEIGAETTHDAVTYFVKDNGAGFDMKYYNKLFGVFQRLHSQKEFDGTGVGLAIVQRIVSKHGGKVWAEAKPNEGAAFYFSIARNSNE